MPAPDMASPVTTSWELPRRHPQPVIPSICYNSCNNAALEAQSVGESPELCDKDSSFNFYYQSCKTCLEERGDNDQSTTRDYLDDSLGQWLSYCDAGSGTVPVTSVTHFSSPKPTFPTGTPVVVTITRTELISGVESTLRQKTTIISYSALPETKFVTVTTSQDGHPTTWIFTTTLTPLPTSPFDTTQSDVSTPIPQTPTSSTPAPRQTSITTNESTQRSRAWIAGPIVGGVVGVAILLLAAFLLVRAKRNKNRRRMGYELHADSAVKSELEAKVAPQELDGQERAKPPAELPGDKPQTREV